MSGMIVPVLHHHIRATAQKKEANFIQSGLKMICFMIFFLLTLEKFPTCNQQDLSGQMFTFPKETDPAHVTIATPNLRLGATTVCLRFFTDITRDYSLFLLATPDQFEYLHLRKARQDFSVAVGGADARFHGHSVKLNAWQSVCCTWDADTGLTQLWLSGNPGTRKFTSTENINGTFNVTLGQETILLSTVNLRIKRSFFGMMTDLQMWDYVLPSDQIQEFSYRGNFPRGNILTWNSLDYQISGSVFIEDGSLCLFYSKS